MGVIKESRASITGAYINPNSMGKKTKTRHHDSSRYFVDDITCLTKRLKLPKTREGAVCTTSERRNVNLGPSSGFRLGGA